MSSYLKNGVAHVLLLRKPFSDARSFRTVKRKVCGQELRPQFCNSWPGARHQPLAPPPLRPRSWERPSASPSPPAPWSRLRCRPRFRGLSRVRAGRRRDFTSLAGTPRKGPGRGGAAFRSSKSAETRRVGVYVVHYVYVVLYAADPSA